MCSFLSWGHSFNCRRPIFRSKVMYYYLSGAFNSIGISSRRKHFLANHPTRETEQLKMTRIQIQRYGAVNTLPLLFAIMPIIHYRPSSRGITFAELVEHSVPRTYDPNNSGETCYETLYNSDANEDGIVKHDEYLSFVGQLSGGEIEVTNYIDLPFVIKINFLYLSCLCMYSPENQIGGECCQGVEAGLDVSGAGPGETPTAAEDDLLTAICRETQGAIDFVRGEASLSPTDIVTKSPTAVLTSTGPTIRVSFIVILTVAPLSA
jgi:hypothetical protein